MTDAEKTLLIIEDSVSITWRLLSFLREIRNLKILGSVRNGTSGFKRIVNETPDIVLLDIQVPGTNGLEILEKISTTTSVNPHVIVLTNNSHFYFKEKCFEWGAKEFYDKSSQFEEAILAIKNLCHG